MKNKRLLEFPFDARNEILRLAGIIYEQDKLMGIIYMAPYRSSDSLVRCLTP